MYEKCIDYARKAVEPANNSVPKYVKLQCKQFIEIWEDRDSISVFDHNKAKKIEVILNFINVPKGACVGEPVTKSLVGWQWLLMVAPFCVVMRDDHSKRRYENILLEIARKNSKSYMSALICLVLLILEPQYSQMFTVAPTGALARETMQQMKEFIGVSPVLADRFKVLRDEIKCKLTDSVYKPLNYSTSTLDGRQPNVFLADEVGAFPIAYPIQAMRSGSVLLKNKLGILMSTKYPTLSNPFEDEVEYCKKVLSGMVEDYKTFALLYEPDNTKDWETDDTILKQANPLAVEIPAVWETLLDNRKKAIEVPAQRENFVTKHCNIIFQGMDLESYVALEDVLSCINPVNDDWWYGRDVYLGVDLSMTNDNTAVTMVTVHDGKVYVKPMCFIPTDRVVEKSKVERVNYKKYIDDGYCIACGDTIIDYATVEQYVINLEQKYGVNIVGLGYDRYNALSSVNKWGTAGINCIEVKQMSAVLHPPTKLLAELISKHDMAIDNNELFIQNFNNCRCLYDNNMNRFITKKRSTGKIDMVVATLNAMYLIYENDVMGADWVVC